MVITGYYPKPTNYTSIGVSVGRGTRRSFDFATSDHIPQSSYKDERATDSCFALIGAHQCGILMVDVGRLAASCPPQVSVETCVFNMWWIQKQQSSKINHQYATLTAPVRATQLSVALPSLLDDWGRPSLVANSRGLWPPAN